MSHFFKALSIALVFSIALPAFADPADGAATGCTGEYRKQIRRTELAIGLGPVVGAAGLVGSGMLALGWEYGGWTALKTTLGPTLTTVAGGAINFVLPTGIAIGTLTYEGIMISRLIRFINAHNLVLGLYQTGENPMLDRLMRRLHKKGSPLSREEVARILIAADQSKKLCDRSISRRKVASLRDMEKMILSTTTSEMASPGPLY
ncbi:MAG: hypothetical protein KGP28_08120 [Bdellovibrionales bacterium]|nr:hypothetical protein [Bdellovibrionales bacterium]